MADIHYFRGTIDEVRIYKRALTEGEIKAHMLSPHLEMMQRLIQDTISKTKAITEQLEKEGIDTSAIEELIASARSALQREAYQIAFEQAQEASLRTGEVWDAFQNYSSIREEVEVKIDQLKKEGVDTSVIERTLLEAEDAVGKGDVELAEQLVSDGDARANKAWQGFEDIENARDKTSEVKELGCDVVDAENRIDDAVDALNKGSYDIVEQYAQEAISLANKASCREIGISDLKALAVRYDGKRIVISGKVRDIETLYGQGYRFTIDDGTGPIMVEYEGSVREIDSGDNVVVKGVFFRSNEVIAAHEVETSGIDAFLWGNFDLILVSVICVVATIGIMAISGGTILYVRSTRKG